MNTLISKLRLGPGLPACMALCLTVAGVAVAGNAQAYDAYCREYQRRVTIGGKVQDSYGTACLQPDGSWKVVGEGAPEVVGSVVPEPVYVPQPAVVYQEPLYVPYQTTYRTAYSPAPLWWGVNLSFNDHHRTSRPVYRHSRHTGSHGGRHGGSHGHGRH